MALVDSRKAPLQLNFLYHGSVHMMSNKLYNKLLESDEGLFHDYILPLISDDLIAKLYSCRTDVRPANYAINHVAAAIFVRMTGLTEENFIEQLPWNIKYQHAIGIEQWSNDIAFSEKTFSSVRKRIKDYNDAHPDEDIWDLITHDIDIKIAKKMSLIDKAYDKKYKYALRIDSLMISMYAAQRPRLDNVYTTMSIVVSDLVDKGVSLPTELLHFTNKDDYRTVVYFKGLYDEYVKEGLPLPSKDEKELTTAQRKEAISDHRLKKLVSELEILRNLCIDSGACDEELFCLLERMISEQTEYKDNKLVPKDKKHISPTSMQSPYEPEATYRFKAGVGYHGYVGFIGELFNKDGDGTIIDRRLEPNSYSDQSYMRSFQKRHDSFLDLNNDEHAFISIDAGFFSVTLNDDSNKLNWDLFCAGVHGAAPSTIFADFKFNENRTTITECPAGKTHFLVSEPSSGVFKLRFPDKCCRDCKNKEECGAVFTGKTENTGSSYVTISEAKHAAALCVRMREGLEGPEILDYLNKRNAIEGINSVLRRKYNIDNRHAGGITFARYIYYGSITCYNINKYFAYLRRKSASYT